MDGGLSGQPLSTFATASRYQSGAGGIAGVIAGAAGALRMPGEQTA